MFNENESCACILMGHASKERLFFFFFRNGRILDDASSSPQLGVLQPFCLIPYPTSSRLRSFGCTFANIFSVCMKNDVFK